MKSPLFDSFLAIVVPLGALAAIGGYLIGSIPWAYLLVRWRSGVDLRREGSGNIGTLNSFVVSRSKRVALAVLILDLAKGFGAAAWGGWIGGGEFAILAVAGGAAVAGHNFPVWLGWKGGRGLAPTAGVMLGVAWPVVPIWILLWGAGFGLLRSINPASALASVAGAVAVGTIPGRWVEALSPGAPPTEFRIFVVLVMGLILLRLVSEVRTYVGEIRERGTRREER